MSSVEFQRPLVAEKHGIDPRTIAIAMTGKYPGWYKGELKDPTHVDKYRGDLALQALTDVKEIDFSLVYVDWDSSPAFLDSVQQLGIPIEIPTEHGMSAEKRYAYKTAAALPDIDVIVGVEPEKVSYIRHGVIFDAAKIILDGKADIAISKRSDASMQTYAPHQVKWERRANKAFHELLKLVPSATNAERKEMRDILDVWFGTRVFHKQVVNLFTDIYSFEMKKIPSRFTHAGHLKIDPEDWANALFIPLMKAIHYGYTIAGHEMEYYEHPKIQTENEIKNPNVFIPKREKQYFSILVPSTHFLHHLQGKNSRLAPTQP